MITEQHDIDLATLADRFTECGDYTKDIILQELRYWQKQPGFLAVLSGDDGFLIGYRFRNSLWIAQVWSRTGLSVGREAIKYAKEWSRERGITDMVFETVRGQEKAMLRYGFKPYSTIMRSEL